jgi:tetratricopeptide (TPR) repeat protein
MDMTKGGSLSSPSNKNNGIISRGVQVGNNSPSVASPRSVGSNSTKQISNSNRMAAAAYSLELQPQRQVSMMSVDADLTDSYMYNNGNGFTPMTSSNTSTGPSLFQSSGGGGVTANNYSTSNVNVNSINPNSNNNNNNSQHSYNNNRTGNFKSDGINGGEAAGKSCLVVPSFGGIKKKKKWSGGGGGSSPSSSSRSPSRKTGTLYKNRNVPKSSSSTSTTSTGGDTNDPFSNEYNDQQGLLNSFQNSMFSSSSSTSSSSSSPSKKKKSRNKKGKGGGRGVSNSSPSARDWYLETMTECEEGQGDDDDDNDANNHSSTKDEHSYNGRSRNINSNSNSWTNNDNSWIKNGYGNGKQQSQSPYKQQQQQQQGDNDVGSPSAADANNNSNSNSNSGADANAAAAAPPSHLLLKLPTAQDRGHQARRRRQRDSGAMYAYEGEMEPEGVRGQEAKITTVSAPTATITAPFTTVTSNNDNSDSRTTATILSLSSPSSPSLQQQQQQEQEQEEPLSVSPTKQPVMAIRSFTNSAQSESSSQLLPIRQVVSNRREQIRNSLLLQREDEGNGNEDNDDLNDDDFDNLDPPHYQENEQQQLQLTPTSSPIRQVVSNRREQIRNSLLLQGEDDVNDNEDNDDLNDDDFDNLDPPHYQEDEQQQLQLTHTSSDNDNDLNDMVSHNLAEISEEVVEDEERSQSQSRSRSVYRLQQQQQQRESEEEKGHTTTSNSMMDTSVQSQRSMHTTATSASATPQTMTVARGGESESLENASSPKAFRRSAPVNIDDSSFEDPLEHIQGIHAMAMEHVMRGEFDLALQAFSQVLQVYVEQHGQAHPLTASAHHNLGTVHTKRAGLLPEHTLHQRHCREEALKCFQAAARSARDCPSLGPNHPNVAVSLVRIGFLLLQSRQYRNAVITFEEALRIRTDNFGPTHGLVANLYNNLGVCHMHLQHFPDGHNYLQQALDIQKELLNQDDYSSTALLELADTLCNIGGLNLEWIRRQGPDARHAFNAESAFLEALELRSKVLGEEHPLTNQVRSLHDMVRSIPIPKGVAAAAAAEPTARPSWSTSPARKYSCDVSEMTNPSPSINNPPINNGHRSMMQKDTGDMISSSSPARSVTDKQNTSNLSIPVLELPAAESFVAKPTISSASVARGGSSTNNNAANDTLMMGGYEATEESCLLRRPADDDQSASQTSDFVTFAQSAAALMNINESSKKESDRMATMRHAKDVLDSNRDFMDSPIRPTTNKDETSVEKTIDERDGNLNEDGLIPLAGNWSGNRNNDRLSPEVLQDPSQQLHTIHNCAASYLSKGRQTEAVTLLEMVVECQKAKNGPLHEDVGSAVHNVGVAYLRMEEHYAALQSFEESVRIRKSALGREHPQVAVSLVKAGISLMLLQRHEDALWIFREALSVRTLALGDLHPSNARIYNNIGCVHVEFNELQEARRAFESALDIQRNALISNPENGPMIFGASTTLQNLGYLYGKRDMYEKAAMVLRESLSVSLYKLESNRGYISVFDKRCHLSRKYFLNCTFLLQCSSSSSSSSLTASRKDNVSRTSYRTFDS